MKIAVLGTGVVGLTLAARLVELGHSVTLGTRDPEATRARTTPDGYATVSVADVLAANPQLGIATFADAVVGAEVVLNATTGSVSLDVLEAVGDALDGTVLLDIANPLDSSNGFPPTLFVKDTDSLAERIQAAHPRVRVVKALNTLTADLMARPALLVGGDHTVFVSGDDAEAKAVVVGLLESMGHTDVIDLGDITTARGTEMLLPLWLRLWGALGTPMFNVKVVR